MSAWYTSTSSRAEAVVVELPQTRNRLNLVYSAYESKRALTQEEKAEAYNLYKTLVEGTRKFSHTRMWPKLLAEHGLRLYLTNRVLGVDRTREPESMFEVLEPTPYRMRIDYKAAVIEDYFTRFPPDVNIASMILAAADGNISQGPIQITSDFVITLAMRLDNPSVTPAPYHYEALFRALSMVSDERLSVAVPRFLSTRVVPNESRIAFAAAAMRWCNIPVAHFPRLIDILSDDRVNPVSPASLYCIAQFVDRDAVWDLVRRGTLRNLDMCAPTPDFEDAKTVMRALTGGDELVRALEEDEEVEVVSPSSARDPKVPRLDVEAGLQNRSVFFRTMHAFNTETGFDGDLDGLVMTDARVRDVLEHFAIHGTPDLKDPVVAVHTLAFATRYVIDSLRVACDRWLANVVRDYYAQGELTTLRSIVGTLSMVGPVRAPHLAWTLFVRTLLVRDPAKPLDPETREAMEAVARDHGIVFTNTESSSR